METIWIFHRYFALASKECEDGAVGLDFLANDSCVDRVLTEAAEGVVLEVCRGRFVLRILKATDNASAHLALWSSTSEDMAWSTFVILEGDRRLEERIDG